MYVLPCIYIAELEAWSDHFHLTDEFSKAQSGYDLPKVIQVCHGNSRIQISEFLPPEPVVSL